MLFHKLFQIKDDLAAIIDIGDIDRRLGPISVAN